jgi:hypothetical protein
MTSTRRSASRGCVMAWPPWIVPVAFAQGTANDAKADVSIDDPLAVVRTRTLSDGKHDFHNADARAVTGIPGLGGYPDSGMRS